MAIGNRNDYWDAVKGMGYLTVLLGHLICYRTFPSRVIFNFHMPLFFFVAGVFARPHKNSLVGDEWRRLERNILIPWVYFAIWCVCYYALTRQLLPHDIMSLMRTVARLWHGKPHFCNSSWFLTCLGVAHMVYWRLKHSKLNIWWWGGAIACMAVSVIMDIIPYMWKMAIPLMLDAVPMALLFYALGDRYGLKVFETIKSLKKSWSILGLLFCAGMALTISHYSGWSNMSRSIYSYLFVPNACMGICVLLLLAKFVCRNPILSWIGKNSIAFFLIEESVIGTVNMIALHWKIVDCPINAYSMSSPCEIATMFVLVLMVSSAIIPFVMFGLRYLQRKIRVG